MSGLNFETEILSRAKIVDQYLADLMARMDLPPGAGIAFLKESMNYSLSTGGKRFRPALTLMLAEAFGVSHSRVLPFAAAVEMIHTYSLIHDDLPSMDNDDFRRGLPTNHKKFGEAFALLAGDALLTEAFLLPVREYAQEPELAVKLVEILSRASGVRGMVGGQAIDLKSSHEKMELREVMHLHHLKTGRLIQVALEGAAWIAKVSLADMQSIRNFGEHLGLAFQVADDVLDQDRADEAHKSFVGIVGLEKTKELLNEVSQQCFAELKSLNRDTAVLESMIEYNRTREK